MLSISISSYFKRQHNTTNHTFGIIMSIKFIATANLPTTWGDFKIHAFVDTADGQEHVLMQYGEISPNDTLITRIHSECLTGDVFFSLKCECGPQLHDAMRKISLAGKGVILYLRQEGRGIGLANKIRAYALQDQGLDTVEANLELGFEEDERNYDICRDMLNYLSIHQVKLITNNPDKVHALERTGIKVVDTIASHVGHNKHNENYIKVKKEKLRQDFDNLGK